MIAEWAAKYRLPTTRDTADMMVVLGDCGSVWEYSDSLLGVTYQGTVKKWTIRKQLGLSVGFRLTQDGDEEGNMVFDPTNRQSSIAAMKVAGITRKRKLSGTHKAKLEAAGHSNRFGTGLKGQVKPV